MRFLFLALVALAAGCGREAVPAAIRVEDRVLSIDDAVSALTRFPGDSITVTLFVENALTRLLILEDACSRGLDTLPEVRSAMHDAARARLQYVYVQYKLGMVEVSEDTISAFHDGMGTLLVYTAIQSDDSVTAESLRVLVASGADASEIAAANTNLQPERASAGRVGPVDRQRMSPMDRSLLEGLEPGDLSTIVETLSGWRFLYLDSMEQVEIPPLDEVHNGIRDFIWAHMSEEYKHVLEDSLVEAFSLTITEGVPELIASHALNPRGDFSGYTDSEAESPAYTWDGGGRTVFSLAYNIRSLPAQMPRNADDPEWVEEYCNLLGLYDIEGMRAVELGMDSEPMLSWDIARDRDGILLDRWFAEVLQPRLHVGEDELAEAWNDNRSMLILPEKRVFSAVAAVTPEQQDLLSSLLASGLDPFVNSEGLTPPASLLSGTGTLLTRPLEAFELPGEAGPAAFALEAGEAFTCSLSRGGLLRLRLEEIIPAREATFEEASPVLAELLGEQEQQLALTGLVDSLKSAYAWSIDWDFFSGFWRDRPSGQGQPGVD